jgi:hypothetical protein
MKNKPDPALYDLQNYPMKIKKRVPKSRETIPLRKDRSSTVTARVLKKPELHKT